MTDSLVLWFDGASKRNPGPAGGGWALARGATMIAAGWCYLGANETNNTAEWHGLLHSLRYVKEKFPTEKLHVRGDSMLVVKQIRGEWKVKADHLKGAHRDATRLSRGVTFSHVRREFNSVADFFSNHAVRTRATSHIETSVPFTLRDATRSVV